MNERLSFLYKDIEEKKTIRIGKWILSITIPLLLFWILTKILFGGIYNFIDVNVINYLGFKFNLKYILIAFLYLIPILVYFNIADARKYKKEMVVLGAIINVVLFALLDIFEMYYCGAGSGWKALGGLIIILETSVPNLLIGSVFCLGAYALMKSKIKIFFPILFIGIAIIAYYF